MITRDLGADEIVIRIKRGRGATGFANFLDVCADGLDCGKIIAPVDAEGVREIAKQIRKHNDHP